MAIGEVLDWFLTKYAGKQTPNLPSRLLYCPDCRKYFTLHQHAMGMACMSHTIKLADETIWNALRAVTGL